MKKPSPEKHPNLCRYLELGIVVVEDDEFVGMASDGEEVHIGNVREEEYDQIERYLKDRGPDRW